MQHPALRRVRTARLARVARRPDDRSAGPASRIGACVDRWIESEHASPARCHPHFRDVLERAAMRTQQRKCLRCRYCDRHGAKAHVLPARVGLQFPAALARDQFVDRDAAMDLDVARERSHQRTHARLADPPVFDRCGPRAVVFHDARTPGIEHAGSQRGLRVTTEGAAARRNELRAVIEREWSDSTRGESPAQAACALEYRDLGIGPREFVGAGQPCHAGTDHRKPHVIHRPGLLSRRAPGLRRHSTTRPAEDGARRGQGQGRWLLE